MTNKLSHFKFTKKENTLNNTVNGRKRENDSLKTERKYSDLLIRILLSSKSYNNKIENKKNQKLINTKRKTLFNNNKFIIKNKNKSPKVYNNISNLNNSKKKNKNIIYNYKTEKKESNVKNRIINKKIDEFKEVIKHNLNLNLETKFSFLKKNNSSSKERIIYNKNKLNIKNLQKKNLNNSTNDKKYKIQQQMIRTNTTENINYLKLNKSNKNQKISIKKMKLMNYFSTNKLNQNNYNKYITLTNREKSHEELKKKENKKSNNKINNKKIVYINLSKHNTESELRTENKIRKFGIIKNNKDSVKKKLLILIDDYNQKKGMKQNNMTFYLSPKRLIDQIRTIKKLNIINKSTV